MRHRTFRFAGVAAAVLGAFAIAAGPATQPAVRPGSHQAAEPSTKPAQLAVATAAVPESLTGGQLSLQAQMAFNRGEYAKALPLLKKQATESQGELTKLGAIQERINVCEKALASLQSALADPQAAATLRPDAPPTEEARKPHIAPKAGAVYETSIKDLGNFQYDQEKGGNVPEDVKKLSGAKIRMRGFMIPMDQAENITQFALVPSLFSCCFGQPPQIQHTIVVNCPKGTAVSYSPDELIVEGTLKVDEKKDEGYLVSLFEMQVGSVKVAPNQ